MNLSETAAPAVTAAALEPSHGAPAAVAAARAALVAEVGAEQVGEHLAVIAEDPVTVSHWFACSQPGYPGWHWSVTVVHTPGADPDAVTIDEVVLLPGEEAIVAPAWVPWRERIQPGDLSPGDILPTDEDDARLVPGYLSGEDGGAPFTKADAKALADEVGLGRARVLSVEGMLAAADRWHAGDFGPGSPLAQSAAHSCASCGFLARLAGPLSGHFGICANEYANADGRVVSLAHGCGAHSEAQLRRKQLPQPVPDPIFDTLSGDDLEEF